MRVLLRLVLQHPCQTFIAASVGLVVGVLGWSIPFLLQKVLDNNSDLKTLTWIVIGICLGAIIRGVLSVFRRYLQLSLVRRVERELALRYLAHVFRLDMSQYEALPSADLVNRLQGLEQIRYALEERILGVAFDVVLVLIAAAIMSRYSLPLTMLALLGAILPAAVVFFIKRSIRDSYKETQRLSAHLSDGCTDALQGIRELRITGGEDWYLRRLEERYLAVQEERTRHHIKLSIIGNGTGLLSALLSIVILLVGSHGIHGGSLSHGQLMFVFTMAGSMLGPLEGLVISWLFFEDAAGVLERYEQVIALPAEARSESPQPVGLRGDIRLERVSFAYRGREPVLRGVSLEIPAGRSIAIVGESGAGKTTLLHLLTGLYSPQEGRVLVDGRDLRDWNLSSWRSQIGVVYQAPHLFHATLEENLRLGCSSAASSDIERALDEASAREFVARLSDGSETKILAGGAPFSGGQVQRLAIARALVRKPSVLLLDEATSNLDLATECAVWNALERGKGNRTTVFVTHRLCSSARADEIVVMSEGQIVERGPFAELLERRGRYYELWKRQLALEVPETQANTREIGVIEAGGALQSS